MHMTGLIESNHPSANQKLNIIDHEKECKMMDDIDMHYAIYSSDVFTIMELSMNICMEDHFHTYFHAVKLVI